MDVLSEEKRATAFHEAGHAIAAVTLGRPFDTVTVYDPTDTSHSLAGVLHSDPQSIPFEEEEWKAKSPRVRKWAETEAIIRLAGLFAKAESGHTHPGGGADSDLKGTADILRQVSVDSADYSRWLPEITGRAQELVKDRWSEIEAVAEELLRKGTLSATEVEEISR